MIPSPRSGTVTPGGIVRIPLIPTKKMAITELPLTLVRKAPGRPR
ncbi:MAG TPA: hypothetical protein VGC32_10570 [Solirubrobacterales bacterium]